MKDAKDFDQRPVWEREPENYIRIRVVQNSPNPLSPASQGSVVPDATDYPLKEDGK